MKMKTYYALISNGGSYKFEAQYYEQAIKKGIEMYGSELVCVVEAECVVDSNFLKLVIGKFNEGATSQELKGLEKYGVPLDPMDDYDWLNMAEEEQIDGYKYLVAERTKRDAVLSEVINNLEELKKFKYDFEHEEVSIPFVETLNEIASKLKLLSKNI